MKLYFTTKTPFPTLVTLAIYKNIFLNIFGCCLQTSGLCFSELRLLLRSLLPMLLNPHLQYSRNIVYNCFSFLLPRESCDENIVIKNININWSIPPSCFAHEWQWDFSNFRTYTVCLINEMYCQGELILNRLEYPIWNREGSINTKTTFIKSWQKQSSWIQICWWWPH